MQTDIPQLDEYGHDPLPRLAANHDPRPDALPILRRKAAALPRRIRSLNPRRLISALLAVRPLDHVPEPDRRRSSGGYERMVPVLPDPRRGALR